MTDYFPCGRVASKTKNAGGHERLTESESSAHDGDRIGLDGDEHVDERRHRTRAFHTIQLDKPRGFSDTNGFRHDFENSDWFKTDHRVVLGVLSINPNPCGR